MSPHAEHTFKCSTLQTSPRTQLRISSDHGFAARWRVRRVLEAGHADDIDSSLAKHSMTRPSMPLIDVKSIDEQALSMTHHNVRARTELEHTAHASEDRLQFRHRNELFVMVLSVQDRGAPDFTP